ncbi:MAG: DUF935 family protein [Deltaproteobacteria bacterium]|nr:DUF935 family protein [Deltaproteobacteria bacterium]
MIKGLYLADESFRAFAEPGKRPEIGEIITRARADSLNLDWFWGLLPDPDYILRKLGASSAEALYSLLADARVGACIQSRKSATRNREILVVPGGEDKADERAAEAAEEMVRAWDLERIVSEALDAPLWGYAPLEVIWEADGKAWQIADLVGKPSWWFGFDQENKLRFLTQTSLTEGEEVPPFKVILARHEASYHNPFGQRLLSRVFWPVTFKRAGWRMWAEFVEKFGSAFVLGKAPANSSSEDRQALATEMAAMIVNSALVYPDGGEVSIHEATGKGSSSLVHRQFKEGCDAEIAVAILGGTLTQEITGQGSRAAAETHYQVLADVAERDQRLVKTVLDQALRWWAGFNHPAAAPPKVVFHEEEDIRADLAERDEILGRQIEFKKEYWSRAYGLSEDEFEVREPAQPGPAGLSESKRPDPIVYLAEGDEETKGTPADVAAWLGDREEALDGLVQAALEESGIAVLTDQILDLVDGAGSLEGLVETLCTGHGRIESGDLAEALTRAVFASGMYGRWAVGQEAGGRAGLKLAADYEVIPAPLPMDEAVKFWKSKVKVDSKTFKRLPQEAKLRAFAAAGIAKGDALNLVFDELGRALEEGASLGEFKKGCRGVFEARGWTGQRARRVETIFLNNVLTSYSVGRYAQMTDPDVLTAFPNWMYVAVRDDRTRPSHAAMNGRVFRADDPIWDQWYPPNGHRCRCTVVSISDRQVKKRGLKVEKGKPILDGQPQNLPGLDGRPSGLVQVITPDRGWQFNPGKASWGGHVDRVTDSKVALKEWPNLPGHDAYRLPAAANLKKLSREPKSLPDLKALKAKGMTNTQAAEYYLKEARKRLGLKPGRDLEIIALDKETVILSDRLFIGRKGRTKLIKGDRGKHIPIMAETLTAPDEIWLTPMKDSTGQVILRRRHLKFYRGEGENLGGFAVFDFERGVGRGVTVYAVKAGQNLLDERYRRGALLWKRGQKK